MSSDAQNAWELKKQRDGIKVYQSTDGSAFKSVRVTATLEGTKQRLIQILRDVDHNHEWVYSTTKSRLIEQINDSNFVYYAETSLPWPMKNRDQAIRLIIHPDTANGVLLVTTAGEPHRIPVTPGIVRITDFSGTWMVTSPDSSHIAIDYFLKVDPNGSIPPWLVNMFVAKGPLETFTKLAELLKKSSG